MPGAYYTGCQKLLPKRDSLGLEFLPLRGQKESNSGTENQVPALFLGRGY